MNSGWPCWLGTLVAADSVGLEINIKREVQYRCKGDNTLHVMGVDLLFPATERSIKRLMAAWWDAKGGRPSTKEARLAHEATKASSRAMPVRFRVALLMLHYWQEKLLTALADINKQMLSNKAAGMVNWFHPASLTSGGRYANNSAPLRAIQAARCMLASAWHICTGGRQAEGFRWRWTDTGVEGVAEHNKPPIWTLGLAGVLQEFQVALGTGYYMINYHCRVYPSLLRGLKLVFILVLLCKLVAQWQVSAAMCCRPCRNGW